MAPQGLPMIADLATDATRANSRACAADSLMRSGKVVEIVWHMLSGALFTASVVKAGRKIL